jgi:hypothetical protein
MAGATVMAEQEVDLSWLAPTQPTQPEQKTPSSGEVDLSWLTPEPQTPVEAAQQIVTQRDEGGFPQKGGDDRSGFAKFGDLITGSERETEATRNLPEFGSEISLQQMLGDDAKFGTAMAALTALDPLELVQILAENASGEMTVRPDEAGNIIIGHNGVEAVLNKPGFTAFDAMQLGGVISAFYPSSKVATLPSTIKGAAGVMALGTGATQAGVELLQASQGGEFNQGDVALAAGTAGLFQGAIQKLSQSMPWLRERIRDNPITEEIRKLYRDVAVKAGGSADDITDDVIRASVEDAAKATAPAESLAIQGEKEFAIPLTQGQRSLDDAALSTEERARVGMRGEGAQRVMRGFEQEQQIPAINRARESIETQIGGQTDNAGATVRSGVKGAERLADDAVSETYEQVGKAELNPQGVKSILRQVRNSVRGVEFDQTLPQTAGVLKSASSLTSTINKLQDKGLKNFDLKRIESMRRRLNNAIGAADNPVDKRQVTIMKRAFDDSVDDAVQNALFSGDDQALVQLKKARGLFNDYAKKFRAQPVKGKSGRTVDPDEAGKFIEKIIDANPTDEQIINSVFGASGLNKGSGAAMARKYKTILGADSEGWQSVRQAAVRRLIKTNTVNGNEVVSGTQTLKAIKDASEKNNTLLKEIFTAEELGLLRRFAAQVKRTQPDLVRSRENPSGTAQVATKGLTDIVRNVGLAFGDVILLGAATGAKKAQGVRAVTKAKNSVKPFEAFQKAKPIAPATATGAAIQGREDQ